MTKLTQFLDTTLHVNLDKIDPRLLSVASVPSHFSVRVNGGKGVVAVTCKDGEIYIDGILFDFSLPRLRPIHPNVAFAMMQHSFIPQSWVDYCKRRGGAIPLGQVVFGSTCSMCGEAQYVLLLSLQGENCWKLGDVLYNHLSGGWIEVPPRPWN